MMRATFEGRENLAMGAMDTIMELYETLYEAALHPENVLIAYGPIIPLYKKLTHFFEANCAYKIFLLAWDQAIADRWEHGH
jgi:hypothetical protein